MSLTSEDVGTVVAVVGGIAAVGGFATSLVALRAAPRTRSRLAVELGIWESFPPDTPQRLAMWEIVARTADRLAVLEDPVHRGRRRLQAVIVLSAVLYLSAFVVGAFLPGLVAVGLMAIALVLGIGAGVGLLLRHRRDRIDTLGRELDGPDGTVTLTLMDHLLIGEPDAVKRAVAKQRSADEASRATS